MYSVRLGYLGVTMFGTLEYDFINVYRVIFVYDTYSRYN